MTVGRRLEFHGNFIIGYPAIVLEDVSFRASRGEG